MQMYATESSGWIWVRARFARGEDGGGEADTCIAYRCLSHCTLCIHLKLILTLNVRCNTVSPITLWGLYLRTVVLTCLESTTALSYLPNLSTGQPFNTARLLTLFWVCNAHHHFPFLPHTTPTPSQSSYTCLITIHPLNSIKHSYRETEPAESHTLETSKLQSENILKSHWHFNTTRSCFINNLISSCQFYSHWKHPQCLQCVAITNTNSTKKITFYF